MENYTTNPKQVVFTVCAFVLLFISSCREDEHYTYCELHPNDCVNIQEVKDYMYFDVGTWWLYEEETTMQKDCVYVVEAYNQIGNYVFDVKTKNTQSDWTLHYWPRYTGGNTNNTECTPGGPIYERCVYIYRSKYKPGDFEAESYCFYFFLKKADFIYNSSGGAPYYSDNKLLVEEELNTYANGSLSYGHTYIISEEHTAIENKQPSNHYYSKGIGLVRKELIDSNEVWNLIAYSIVK